MDPKSLFSLSDHLEGLGRQCSSLKAQRDVAVGPDADVPHPPAQTHGQANVEGNRAGQCRKILDPSPY